MKNGNYFLIFIFVIERFRNKFMFYICKYIGIIVFKILVNFFFLDLVDLYFF